MYVITGATGNVGKVIATLLLAQKQKVRVIGRDEKRLAPFAEQGAEIATGSLSDVAFLKKALGGATAVFAMIPPDMQAENVARSQDTVGEALTRGLAAAGVRRIINLSSVGAELESGTGPIAGLHRQENRLNQLEAEILHFRPTYFMENFLHQIPMIRNMGINGSSISGDLPMAMIATKDIARVAAERLLKLDFSGKSVIYLLGPKEYTQTEATRILGDSIDKPALPYITFSYEDAEKGMIGAGILADMARSFNEMHRSFNEGRVGKNQRKPENTTPTTFEEFATTIFAPAYKAT